jgi:hypothetical protein
MPASIMFFITVAFVALFFVPAIAFQKSNKIVNFYWVGCWIFLGMIASVSGAQNTLMLLGYNADAVAESVLAAFVMCFVFFVVFAWFRLSSVALWHGFKKIVKISKQS